MVGCGLTHIRVMDFVGWSLGPDCELSPAALLCFWVLTSCGLLSAVMVDVTWGSAILNHIKA